MISGRVSSVTAWVQIRYSRVVKRTREPENQGTEIMSDNFKGLAQGASAKRVNRTWRKCSKSLGDVASHLRVSFPDGLTFDTEDSPEEISRLLDGSSDVFTQHDFFVAFRASMMELAKTQRDNFQMLRNIPDIYPWEWFNYQVEKTIDETFQTES